MFKLTYLGAIQIPRGAVYAGLKTLSKTLLERRELSQSTLDEKFSKQLKNSLKQIAGQAINWISQESLLIYKKVGEHVDDLDWGKTEYKNRRVSTAFMHVVLHGSCEIKSGSKILRVKKGDVFLLNPNAMHEVTSSTLCMTYCLDVPAVAIPRRSHELHHHRH